MQLRKLEKKDAEFMLEWMHDPNVYNCLGKDFNSMTIDNCIAFIEGTKENDSSYHLAITDDCDEYMGTISLKEIDRENKRAEYAIACRTKAMGKGFASFATKELFRIAKEELGLSLIYLNVYETNIRAQKLYIKVGFTKISKPDFIQEENDKLIWFEKRL
ncbi:MAG: GNAT family N-acetyltransferase [Lachnospiraceae bacterium]|nr:GNAT family N-acetyltransferase [Lachnospiraceae bacterium]